MKRNEITCTCSYKRGCFIIAIKNDYATIFSDFSKHSRKKIAFLTFYETIKIKICLLNISYLLNNSHAFTGTKKMLRANI